MLCLTQATTSKASNNYEAPGLLVVAQKSIWRRKNLCNGERSSLFELNNISRFSSNLAFLHTSAHSFIHSSSFVYCLLFLSQFSVLSASRNTGLERHSAAEEVKNFFRETFSPCTNNFFWKVLKVWQEFLVRATKVVPRFGEISNWVGQTVNEKKITI